jgi:O-antigen/teichoic acid export membrane protein
LKILKTTFYSALITFIRIASGFVASKVIAIITGPIGVALVGTFSNFITIALTFANGAINTGVIKYTADYENDIDKQKRLFGTALKITVYCSFTCGIILVIFAGFWANSISSSSLYKWPIISLGLSIVFYALNTLLISILNGRKDIKTYTNVNTIGSIISLAFTVVMVYFFKIVGALYALALSQSIVFIITFFYTINSNWFSFSLFSQKFSKDEAIKLSRFSLMAIVSALLIPLSQIILRNHVSSKFSLVDAGYWQGMMRISDAYLMIVTTSLSTYFLPKLSSLKTNKELRTEIIKGYKLILPVVFLMTLLIYFLRFLIIRILFTPDFIVMEKLFYWQLIGDFFKIASYILGYLMLAKAMTRLYIATEVIFTFSYVILGYFLTDKYGLEGIVIAFGINYIICFLFIAYSFRQLLFGIGTLKDFSDGTN